VAGTGGDWAAQTADTIERVVGGIGEKTVGRIERVARIVVYGLVAAIVGLIALVLLIIALVRLADAYLPIGNVWLPYLVVGGIFVLLGLFFWRKRSVKTVKV
jgi:hypothetical protein